MGTLPFRSPGARKPAPGPPDCSGAASGRIVAFDQTEFVQGNAAAVSGNAAANGLSDTGYVYVPKACEPEAPQRCRLQIVLHGCKQSAEVLQPRGGIGSLALTGASRVLD